MNDNTIPTAAFVIVEVKESGPRYTLTRRYKGKPYGWEAGGKVFFQMLALEGLFDAPGAITTFTPVNCTRVVLGEV